MALITRETDYAMRALARLALSDANVPVSRLAEREEIPTVFLRKIMQRLQKAGFVASRQGALGGYRLVVEPEDLSMLDIVQAVQGPVALNACFAEEGICGRIDWCPFRTKLESLQDEVNQRLEDALLSDAVECIRIQDEQDHAEVQ
jgi:Rrf2 family protein